MKLDKDVLEQVSDDLELRLDNFFNKIHQYALKEARKLKEDEVRAVCVDHQHVPADSIKQIYAKLLKEHFDPHYNLVEFLQEWEKEATWS